MLNPAIELKAKKQQFISIRELIVRIESKYPDMTRDQIANWIIIRLDEEQEFAPSLLIQDARGITRKPSFSDPSFSAYELLSRVMASPAMDNPPYEGWTPSITREDQAQASTDLDFDSDIPF
ncbi:TPA: hypothetical protein NPO56_001369 [Klebsiella quasipneumoniae subsp. quasipneumoniae]|uniref:hypothetical protein n=1 Tax=Klebsiella quasipneumoniae TaxID=1463165 RepID=UPI000E3EA6F9|nr:hypothetical protein [Klebsiella quasipneumoniae]HCI5779673.1 hypothetical protein [Klebsiella quasipneumoniae subsp. quasipneumoniae]HCI6915950.1 hypothetical protein [Klebsiella quasipneumoniae subsp. similipneumoniae]HCI6119059.1 hypothetical protein [Klebsiella quasipneumoniae subsp. quasipneumoniae]HCI6219616.1 hypothetical protein [Klebsiella quasipneumoniae subsp. quasipneumoniae]HCI6264280.1 hypothetical protein [Klebsiella quasipneumoniae subsp. quasipneumoniae]